MLFSLGHGQHTFLEKSEDSKTSSADKPLSSAMELPSEGVGDLGGKFAFYFPDAPSVAHTPDIAAKLDALANAMVEQAPEDATLNTVIPPIYTYFGQFIDHDATANTDRESGTSNIRDDALEPVGRSEVERDLLNLRNGSMRLDSLYGDGPGGGAFSKKLQDMMRFPADKAKMRLGVPVTIPNQTPPLPDDPASDLLRIGRLISDDTNSGITLEELRALPGDLRQSYLDQNENLIPQRAVIGDARNDENLIIAQLQVAFLRFHNKTVDWLRSTGAAENGTEALFTQASQLVKWHYQWLIVNDFLKRICREDMLDFVISQGASVYTEFFNRNRPTDPNRMPMPLEFSVAAYRFGHTMVRNEYDYNRVFGTAVPGSSPPLLDNASLQLLFTFTGRSPTPMPSQAGGQHVRLPSNWIIEWDRFVGEPVENSERSSRKLDTFLSPQLKDMPNEMEGVFRHLGQRNLRRGHKLNIPSAQACISEFNRISGSEITNLTSDELLSGDTGEAVASGGFDVDTPLWFYVLKEAEVRESGNRLGMLGSAIVADTLVGLIANDPESFWSAPCSNNIRWQPSDGVHGHNGEIVDNLSAFLRFAGML